MRQTLVTAAATDSESYLMIATRLLIVDSDQRFWDNAQFELAIDPRIDQITRIDSAQSAMANVGLTKPNIAIINMTVPGPATSDLIRTLYSGIESTPIIALFDSLDDGRVGYAVGAGARACISRTSLAKQIRGTVIEVLAGELPIHRDVAERPYLLAGLIVEFQRQSHGVAKVETTACPLTDRELTVLSHVADGNANKEIADLLYISERTVKNHMTNILAKLSAHDRAHAVRFGIQNSWISLGQPEPVLSLVA
jgi:DNA-binding NarL/FixJ family response regulator